MGSFSVLALWKHQHLVGRTLAVASMVKLGENVYRISTPCAILVSSLPYLNSADFSRSYLYTTAEPLETTLLGAEFGHADMLLHCCEKGMVSG